MSRTFLLFYSDRLFSRNVFSWEAMCISCILAVVIHHVCQFSSENAFRMQLIKCRVAALHRQHFLLVQHWSGLGIQGSCCQYHMEGTLSFQRQSTGFSTPRPGNIAIRCMRHHKLVCGTIYGSCHHFTFHLAGVDQVFISGDEVSSYAMAQ